jgi:hypothetical protein
VSGFWSMRRLMTGAIIAATVAGTTCLLAQNAPTAGPALPPGGATPDPNAAIATILGKDINNKAFYDILMQVAGMRVFQQVFDLTLVQNACMMSGVSLQGDEFTKRLTDEYNRTLAGLNVTLTAPTTWTGTKPVEEQKKEWENNAREQALNYVLQRQGVTAMEFRIKLETQANLRALSNNARITVEPKEVEEAYDAEYGEKRQIHIFLINDKDTTASNTAAKVRAAIAENIAKPEGDRRSLEEVAQRNTWPQPQAWTISFNAKGIDEILKAAFAMKKDGEISADTAVKQGDQTQHVMIVLDKILADTRTAHPKTPAEMENLKKKVQELKENQWMNNQLALLRANAAPTVKINDPILKDQFDRMAKAMQEQAAAAAAATQTTGTAPSSAPAIPAPARGGMSIPSR